MASPSDFYVQPGNDASQALSGLSGTLGQMRQDKARQAERQQLIDAQNAKDKRIYDRAMEASTAVREAQATGDPAKMADVVLQYPEVGQGLTQALGLIDDDKKQKAAGFSRSLITNPENAEQIYQDRIDEIRSRGGDPKDTIRSREAFRRNPQGEANNLEMIWAATGDPSYAAYSGEKKAAAKAAADQAKIDRDEDHFNRSEQGKNNRAAMSAGDRALTRQIAVLAAQQGAEMNDLKKQELGLKIDEKQNKLEQNKLEVQKGTDTAVANIDSSINAADKLLNHPGFSGAVGLSSAFPTVPGSKSADFEAELDSFNAKTFLANVAQMKGLGALTEAEGAKLTSAAGAIKKNMSEDALRSNLQTMKDGMEKAKERIAKRSPAPAKASGPAEVTSQSQFDALPSGAVYLEDGVQYRKP